MYSVDSGGLGMELARLLYQDGFSLVLVARDAAGLQDLKESLETSAADSTMTMTEAQDARIGSRSSHNVPTPSSSGGHSTEGEDGQGLGENSGNDLNVDGYEDDNTLARRHAYPQSNAHDRQARTAASSKSNSSPTTIYDNFRDTDTSTFAKSSLIPDTVAKESTAATKQQQQQQQLSVAKGLPDLRAQSSSSSPPRRRRLRGSGSSDVIDRRVTNPPQLPAATTPSTPGSPNPSAFDVPHPRPQQEIVLIPADLSSRSTSPLLLSPDPNSHHPLTMIEWCLNSEQCEGMYHYVETARVDK